MADNATLTQDQDFLNAPVHEKHAYLMDTDPDYAKAPPHEQLQYMLDLHQTQFSERGAAQQPPIARPAGGESDIERSWQKTEGLREQRERIGQRAMRAPAPITAASAVVMPLASEMKAGKLLSAVGKTGGRLAGGAAGATGGGYAGRRLGGMVGAPDVGEAIGSAVGGIGGWVLGGGRGELTEEQTLAKAVREKKANYLPTRIKTPKVEEASPFAGMTSSAETGKPEVKVDSSGLGETSGQKAKLVTKMQAAKDEAAAGAGTGRRVILAGEGIDPMRTESAGSAAQATEGDLRRLASAGDASARQELVRRRLQRGVTDYKNVPLPQGQGGGIIGGEEPPMASPKEPTPAPAPRPNLKDGVKVGKVNASAEEEGYGKDFAASVEKTQGAWTKYWNKDLPPNLRADVEPGTVLYHGVPDEALESVRSGGLDARNPGKTSGSTGKGGGWMDEFLESGYVRDHPPGTVYLADSPEAAAAYGKNVVKVRVTPELARRLAVGDEMAGAVGHNEYTVHGTIDPKDIEVGGALERRSAPREVQGPDLMRTARAQELRTQLEDPSLSARDRRIMQDQLDDIKNNPFERHEGGDIQSMKKPKPRMSRKEAEASTEARKVGRKKRFGGPPVPEE